MEEEKLSTERLSSIGASRSPYGLPAPGCVERSPEAVKEFGANEKQENLDLTERNGTQ